MAASDFLRALLSTVCQPSTPSSAAGAIADLTSAANGAVNVASAGVDFVHTGFPAVLALASFPSAFGASTADADAGLLARLLAGFLAGAGAGVDGNAFAAGAGAGAGAGAAFVRPGFLAPFVASFPGAFETSTVDATSALVTVLIAFLVAFLSALVLGDSQGPPSVSDTSTVAADGSMVAGGASSGIVGDGNLGSSSSGRAD